MAALKHGFPMGQFVQFWQKGLAGAFIPKKYGGCGFSMADTHKVRHKLMSADQAVRPILAAQYKAQVALQQSERAAQQDFYFSLMSQHHAVAASVIESYPKNCKSEATFKKVGEGYTLNGRSVPFTNAGAASFYVVEATEEPAGHSSQEKMVFIVDKHRLGISIEAPDNTMTLEEGAHTRKVSLYDVKLTSDAVVGKGKELSSLLSAMLEEVM